MTASYKRAAPPRVSIWYIAEFILKRRRKQLSTTSRGSRQANRILARGNRRAMSGSFNVFIGYLSTNVLPAIWTPARRTRSQYASRNARSSDSSALASGVRSSGSRSEERRVGREGREVG